MRRSRRRPAGPGTRDEEILAGWREVAGSAQQSRCPDTRYAERWRVLRDHCAGRERRRGSGRDSSGVDEQPLARRRVQEPGRAEKHVRGAGVTPDREVVTYCQGGYRAAHSYLALRLIGYPARPQLRRIVERVGRSRRSAHRAPQGTVNGQHRQGRRLTSTCSAIATLTS